MCSNCSRGAYDHDKLDRPAKEVCLHERQVWNVPDGRFVCAKCLEPMPQETAQETERDSRLQQALASEYESQMEQDRRAPGTTFAAAQARLGRAIDLLTEKAKRQL